MIGPNENPKSPKTLTELLSDASLLLNTWVNANIPNADTEFFAPSLSTYASNLQKLIKLSKENHPHRNSGLETQLAEMGLQANHSFTACLVSILKQMGRKSAYVVYPNFDLQAEQRPYLCESTDLCARLKPVLNQMKALLTAKPLTFSECFGFAFIYKNLLLTVLKSQKATYKIDTKFIKQWLKFILDFFIAIQTPTMLSPSLEELKLVQQALSIIAFDGLDCAINLALLAANKAKSDLDYANAESITTIAYNLYKFCTTVVGDQSTLNALLYKIFACYIKTIDDIDRMQYYAEKIPDNCPPDLDIIYILMGHALHFKEKEPLTMMRYYLKALRIQQQYQPLPEISDQDILTNAMHAANINVLKAEIQKIQGVCLLKLKDIIKAAFPEFKVTSSKSAQLNVYIPREEPKRIPKAFFALFSKYNLQAVMSDKFIGLGLIIQEADEETVMADLDKLQYQLQAIKIKPTRVKQTPKTENLVDTQKEPTQPTIEPIPAAASAPTLPKSEMRGIIQSPPEKYTAPERSEKIKTRAIGPAPAPAAATPAAITTELHTHDFGFYIEGNPPITPVYCSQGAQQARRTKIYLRWEGIRDCDALVEKQFQEMLNPHPDGILTVGTYGQPGAKLWKDPEGLGNEWGQCALRLKRKGAAGFARAIAVPECHIVVDNAGTTEHRYLFKLGKIVHK